METAAGVFPKQRLEALSDGIYAIALTLLVLELKVPTLEHGASNAELVATLRATLPKAMTWLLSFWVMVMFWLGQARVYALVRSATASLVWTELMHLALISLVPFSTALLGEYPDLPVAAVLYASNILAVSLASALRTSVVLSSPAIGAQATDKQTQHRLKVRAAALVACSALSLALGFFFPAWNMLAMLPTALLPIMARV